MNDQWFCKIIDREFGPMPLAELAERLARGELSLDDSVRQAADDQWREAESVSCLCELAGLSDRATGVSDSSESAAMGGAVSIDPPDQLAEFQFVESLDNTRKQPHADSATATARQSKVIWFCQIAGIEFGPLSRDQLREMVAEGNLSRQTAVRQGESGVWIPAERLRDLFPDESQPAGFAECEETNELAAAGVLEPVAVSPGFDRLVEQFCLSLDRVEELFTADPKLLSRCRRLRNQFDELFRSYTNRSSKPVTDGTDPPADSEPDGLPADSVDETASSEASRADSGKAVRDIPPSQQSAPADLETKVNPPPAVLRNIEPVTRSIKPSTTSPPTRHGSTRAGRDQAAPTDWIKRLGIGKLLIAVGLVALVAMATSQLADQGKQQVYQQAYDDLDQLYNTLQQVRRSKSSVQDRIAFDKKFDSTQKLVLARTGAAPKGSAGNAVAGAARFLATLAVMTAQAGGSADAQESRRLIDERFHEHMKLAQQKLSGK